MLFSGIPFLFYFLPITLVLYAIAPGKLKNPVLVFASLIFYAWGEPKYVILMVATITAGYGFGLLIEKCRKRGRYSGLAFSMGVICVLLSLGFFKYTDFLLGTINSVAKTNISLPCIALPIGISFYSFQLISYLADVYRGEETAQRNYFDLAAYISFFPQLIAGPIVRYGDVAKQLKERKHTPEKISYGAGRFVIGLSKKMLIANVLAEFCQAFYNFGEKSTLLTWGYAIAYSLQVYFDFSGYSDMAIGLGSIFGFEFPENFNYPFISGSVTEFWRRWHMTLGSWFRDYVYIPLGGNRRGTAIHLRNIFVVWALTGLWHGASWNFVVWGLYYAVLLLIDKYCLGKLLSKTGPLKYILTAFATIIGFVIFDSATMKSAMLVFESMAGLSEYGLLTTEGLYYIRSYGPVMLLAIIGATPLPKKAYSRLKEERTWGSILSLIEPLYLVILLMVCVAYMVDGSFNPFLYFRF